MCTVFNPHFGISNLYVHDEQSKPMWSVLSKFFIVPRDIPKPLTMEAIDQIMFILDTHNFVLGLDSGQVSFSIGDGYSTINQVVLQNTLGYLKNKSFFF